MCDDLETTVEELTRKGVEFTRPVSDEGWGLLTALRFPAAASWRFTSRATPVRSRRAADERLAAAALAARRGTCVVRGWTRLAE
jgi:hypothetical protein